MELTGYPVIRVNNRQTIKSLPLDSAPDLESAHETAHLC